ncbi:sensor histidine kinase [Microbacterium sp. NC79]|uniref:sensor histidine kinase n=1 Tax=Microbacterium sp. NC79 TaxID=2851009 RepID=UPI00349F8016
MAESIRRVPGLSARVRLTLVITAVAVISSGALWVVTALWVLRYLPTGNYSLDSGMWMPGRDDIMEVFMPIATTAFFAISGLAFVGGWFLAGRILQPLTAIATVAHGVSRGDLSKRVALPGPRDEFRDVADAFDSMLDSVESTVNAQRRFAANASHELRTPLAITRSVLDVAQADPERDATAVFTQLQLLNDRAASSADALLLLARLDSVKPDMESVDLSLIVEEALEVLQLIADKQGVTLETDLHPTHVLGNAGLLDRLASNLIHNAIAHNAPTHRQKRVFVQVAVHDSAAVLRVVNTGAQLSPHIVATLTEPFARGERTTARDDTGAGLGLALSATIVRVHGGSLVLQPRAEGGLTVTARFAEG